LPETPTTGTVRTAGELNGTAIAVPVTPNQPCRGQRPQDPGQVGQLSDCYTPAPEFPAGELPLTAGRELVEKSDWNIWVDGSATRIRDTRDGMDTRGNTSSFSMGIDRVVNDDLVAGLQMSVSKAKSSSFDDAMQSDSTSYSVGPYLSYSLTDNWLLYGSLGFGKQSVDKQLLVFSGTSDSVQYSLSLQTEGQYAFGAAVVRPKVQLSYMHNEGDAYQLKGVILNTPLTLNMRNQSFNYGVVQTSVELNQTFDLGNNRMVMPFIEAGVYYEYERPGSGQHLTSNLTYANSSPWGGVIRAGARSLVGASTMASFDVANQTVGVNDVNIWEVRLLISHSF
jgi:outer membrane autotransporter protein